MKFKMKGLKEGKVDGSKVVGFVLFFCFYVLDMKKVGSWGFFCNKMVFYE